MSNTPKAQTQADNDADEPNWFEAEIVEPLPNWGPFLPWRAVKAFFPLTRGNTQHIAMVIARITPRDGKVFVVQKDICLESGRGDKTVRAAIKKLHALGILAKAKRTMGGFDCVWGKVAYGLTDDAKVGQRAEKASSQASAALRDSLRQALRPAYVAAICGSEQYGFQVRADSPRIAELSALTITAEKRIVENLVYFAMSSRTPKAPYDNARFVLSRWVSLPGNGGFLLRCGHPLERFAQDASALVCRLLAEQGRDEVEADSSEIAQSRVVGKTAVDRTQAEKQRNAQDAAKLLAVLRRGSIAA